jgi:hypothetical protein
MHRAVGGVRRSDSGVGGGTNSAWLLLSAIAFNLARASGARASSLHAKAAAPPSDRK